MSRTKWDYPTEYTDEHRAELDAIHAQYEPLVKAAEEMLGVCADSFCDVVRNGNHDTQNFCPLCGITHHEVDPDCSVEKLKEALTTIKKARGE